MMFSTRAGEALPVRTEASSCAMWAMVLSRPSSISSITSSVSITKKSGRLIRGRGEFGRQAFIRRDQRAHFLTHDDPLNIVLLEHVKNNNRQLVIHTEPKGRGIHDLQLP